MASVGWLQVGIRAPKADIFISHLDTYEKDFQTGEEVSAGDILGIWEIPDMVQKVRVACFRFIFIWEFISGHRIMRN